MTGAGTVAVTAMLMVADPPPAAAPTTAESAATEFTLLPGVWFPRLDGESGLAPGGKIDLSSQLLLDDSEPTFNAELAIRRGDVWEVILGGFGFSTDSSGRFSGSATFGSLTLDPGDPFRASFDITSVSAELGVSLWRPFTRDEQRIAELDNRNWEGKYIADLRITPTFGMRYVDVEQSVSLADGSRQVAGGEWAGVLVGVQITLDYRPQEHIPLVTMLRMQVSAAVGPALGGDGGYMAQVRGGLTLQFTEQLGLMFGYRLLELNVDNDDYTLEGGLQGLFVAGSLRF